jgi:hypothetical protein
MRILAVPLMLVAGSVLAQEAPSPPAPRSDAAPATVRPEPDGTPTASLSKTERVGTFTVTTYGNVRVWRPDPPSPSPAPTIGSYAAPSAAVTYTWPDYSSSVDTSDYAGTMDYLPGYYAPGYGLGYGYPGHRPHFRAGRRAIPFGGLGHRMRFR